MSSVSKKPESGEKESAQKFQQSSRNHSLPRGDTLKSNMSVNRSFNERFEVKQARKKSSTVKQKHAIDTQSQERCEFKELIILWFFKMCFISEINMFYLVYHKISEKPVKLVKRNVQKVPKFRLLTKRIKLLNKLSKLKETKKIYKRIEMNKTFQLTPTKGKCAFG